jgi:hypothetical protein
MNIAHQNNSEESIRSLRELDVLSKQIKRMVLIDYKISETLSNAIEHLFKINQDYLEVNRKSFYYKKFKFYTRAINLERQYIYDNCVFDNSSDEKLEILLNLATAASFLSENNDTELTAVFNGLENQLFHYLHLTGQAAYCFYYITPYKYCTDPTEFSIEYLKLLLSILLKLIIRKGHRDLRFCYQCIVRFLFKNMDDESGDKNNLIFSFEYLKFFIYHLNHRSYEWRLSKIT